MKKQMILLGAIAGAALLSGCATTIPQGTFYTDVKVPVAATSSTAANLKTGVSSCKSYCGVVTIGDASIEAAKKNGGIKKVVSVDWKAKSILGLVGQYECIVKGE
ncbi:MAG: TRL-like family protein [Opitutales bacterium]|nr:TRL-like family protein [Opitutales bacterium]